MLKKVVLSSTLLLSSYAADPSLPNGEINILNAKYSTPTGTGDARYINIEDFGEFTNPKLEVDNANGLLIFSVDDQSFELDLSMLGITDAEKIDLGNLNFYNQAEKIKLNLSSANAFDSEFKVKGRSASLDCTRERAYEDIKDDLLAACLKNATLRASSFYFWSKGEEFESLMIDETLGSEVTVEGLKVDVRNHRVTAEFKSNISKGIKVKIEGTSSYDPDYRKITLKLSKAKAGFINIKKKLFKELSKVKSESIEVREPYIYIQLD